MINDELINELADAKHEITQLRQKVKQLERSVSHRSLPETMLLDHSFLKRALAVYGHMIVAGLLITLPFYCIAFFIAMVAQ